MQLVGSADELRLENNGHIVATIQLGCGTCNRVRILWPRPGLCGNVYTVSVDQLVAFLESLGVDPACVDLMIG